MRAGRVFDDEEGTFAVPFSVHLALETPRWPRKHISDRPTNRDCRDRPQPARGEDRQIVAPKVGRRVGRISESAYGAYDRRNRGQDAEPKTKSSDDTDEGH